MWLSCVALASMTLLNLPSGWSDPNSAQLCCGEHESGLSSQGDLSPGSERATALERMQLFSSSRELPMVPHSSVHFQCGTWMRVDIPTVCSLPPQFHPKKTPTSPFQVLPTQCCCWASVSHTGPIFHAGPSSPKLASIPMLGLSLSCPISSFEVRWYHRISSALQALDEFPPSSSLHDSPHTAFLLQSSHPTLSTMFFCIFVGSCIKGEEF